MTTRELPIASIKATRYNALPEIYYILVVLLIDTMKMKSINRLLREWSGLPNYEVLF